MSKKKIMKQVRLVTLQSYQESNGDLVIAESLSNEIPFDIKRVFNVRASNINDVRGKHAHKLCSQLLICTNGAIEVYCDNFLETKLYHLNKANFGLLIPPGVWSEQKYVSENSVLTVLCDQLYDEDDYIRDYEEFKLFLNNKNG